MEVQGLILIATCTLGFISLCTHLGNILKWVWVMFLRPSKNLKHYGSWALITGSTGGIGRALASELASKGLNLLLLDRDPLELDATSQHIRKQNDGFVEVRTIAIDFAKQCGEEIAKRIEEEIEDLDVGILINNAGLAYPFARFFHEVGFDLVESVVGVNIVGTTWVTKAVLPGMLKRKKGAIVNIGSGSSVAVSSYPLYTIYAATKAYIAMLSRCMGLEYKYHGIDIQCQVPLFVATKMTSIRRSSFFIPSPETFSKASVRAIGQAQISVPYWPHALQCCIIKLLPDALLDRCLFWYFSGMRMRGIEQQQKKRQARAASG
ncbi:very-long-chain 3-oxoacyl-CoA reductase 1-like [Actinidia eriantha]|uniref:very-long-chain 3-oxoacyl-CoA reductase 1-like n=1 Tax=Actinidia eriantha TaxID=165200 RepID=UPI00259083E7|nr:very-long-chain 3-oxoacyl-CoA reductase 1-like [Actinidia eriantha]